MATTFTFGGKNIIEPGVYTQVLSGVTNPPLGLAYSNLLVIDTGSGAGYGYGSGINGFLSSNKDSIYSFNTLEQFRTFVRGGLYYDLAKQFFQPSATQGVKGVSNLFIVKAATTVPAQIEWTFGEDSVSSSESQIDLSTLSIYVKNEGLVGNGVLYGDVLTRGYAVKMVAGKLDPTKFIFNFYAGTFRGLDADGDLYGGVTEDKAKPELIASSTEVSTLQELIDWMNKDYYFNLFFKFNASEGNTYTFTSSDLVTYGSYNLAEGGTETYNDDLVDTILENIGELDYQFILSDKSNVDATGEVNDKILTHLRTDSKYGFMMVVAGGDDVNEFRSTGGSVDIAEHFDSQNVIVVHGGFKKVKKAGSGHKIYNSYYKAANVAGRILGLEPQAPGTFKDLDMDADLHDMKTIDREFALTKGVLHTRWEDSFNQFVINQAINTLQDNTNLINEDATTHEVSILRINNLLMKELVFGVKRDLIKGEQGVNRNTLSTAVLIEYTKTYLKNRTATPEEDNLILDFRKVTSEIRSDAIFIQFEYVPNLPINKVFITGIMVDVVI